MSVQNIVALEPVLQATRVRLQNFDVNRATLKIEHQNFLQSQILPILRAGGSLRLIGLASRTGGYDLNNRLSQARRDAVLRFLLIHISTVDLRIALSDARGERAAELAGVADERETPEWRSVIVSAWNRRIPPPEDRVQPIVHRPPAAGNWIGAGLKGGVTIGIGGGEQVAGIVVNTQTRQLAMIGISSLRFPAIGFGVGVGISLIYVFNAPNIGQIDGMSLDGDWSANIALGIQWGRLVRVARASGKFSRLFTLLNQYQQMKRSGLPFRLSPDQYSNIRDLFSALSTGLDLTKIGNAPTVLVVDTPLSGGEELSYNIMNHGRISATALTEGEIVHSR